MKGTYLQNKKSIYNYREKNLDKCKAIRMRSYYKNKIAKTSRVWAEIMYEFLDILREDLNN